MLTRRSLGIVLFAVVMLSPELTRPTGFGVYATVARPRSAVRTPAP
jgi:hypothetical protein